MQTFGNGVIPDPDPEPIPDHTGDDFTPFGVNLDDGVPEDDDAEPEDAGILHEAPPFGPEEELS